MAAATESKEQCLLQRMKIPHLVTSNLALNICDPPHACSGGLAARVDGATAAELPGFRKPATIPTGQAPNPFTTRAGLNLLSSKSKLFPAFSTSAGGQTINLLPTLET